VALGRRPRAQTRQGGAGAGGRGDARLELGVLEQDEGTQDGQGPVAERREHVFETLRRAADGSGPLQAVLQPVGERRVEVGQGRPGAARQVRPRRALAVIDAAGRGGQRR